MNEILLDIGKIVDVNFDGGQVLTCLIIGKRQILPAAKIEDCEAVDYIAVPYPDGYNKGNFAYFNHFEIGYVHNPDDGNFTPNTNENPVPQVPTAPVEPTTPTAPTDQVLQQKRVTNTANVFKGVDGTEIPTRLSRPTF